ncbi:MAG: HlyD family secretion protein [Alphaproteobacteria bacterium]|nr:HlyD family secretion protein [Alphaproteobacteria bacterium]
MPADLAEIRPRETVVRSPTVLARTRRVGLVLGIVLAGFAGWEILTSIIAYTDDAYVRSDLVGVSPQVSGPIVGVHVVDNQKVRRGDLLITIDPVPFQLAVDERQAEVREANAQVAADRAQAAGAQDQIAAAAAALDLARETQRRIASLAGQNFAPRQRLDETDEGVKRAQANLDGARAALAKAQEALARDEAAIARAQAALGTAVWRLDQTKLFAPVDGSINNLTVRVGDTAVTNVPLVGIVDAHAWRIMANYKQYYLRSFRTDGTAWVWLDSNPWRFYRARIQGIGRGISRSTGPSELLPYVAPTTDWIRLQRRFPVTVVLDEPPPDGTLYMGADARVVIFP